MHEHRTEVIRQQTLVFGEMHGQVLVQQSLQSLAAGVVVMRCRQ